MLKRVLFLLVAICISFTANSGNPYPLINPQKIDVPSCEVFGMNVQYRTAPSRAFALDNTFLAFAGRSTDGNLTVWVDSDNFFRPIVAPEFQRFILYHECGHHSLGHIRAGYQGDKRNWEPNADCFAIRKLKEEGYTSAEFKIIEEQASDIKLVNQLTPYPSMEINASGFNARSKHLKQCIEKVDGYR